MQADIASGSKVRTVAPPSTSACTTGSAGDSRMSSVFGLKERPRTAIVLPAKPPSDWSTFSIIRFWVTSLTSSTASMMRNFSPESRAIWAAARVSLGKQEPP